MSIELENPKSVLGKVDAAANYVAQIRLAMTLGDGERVMVATEQAARLLFDAHTQIEKAPAPVLEVKSHGYMQNEREKLLAFEREDQANVALAAASAVFDQITQSLTAERDAMREDWQRMKDQLALCEEHAGKMAKDFDASVAIIRQDRDALRAEMDAFTKHVGAPTFQEAVGVCFRSNAQNMDVIQEQFDKVKALAAENRRLKATPALYDDDIAEILERVRDCIPGLSQDVAETFRRIAAELLQGKTPIDESEGA